ncbi:MAG: hypothetical protein ACO1RT_11705 [Planctomycetaceae bacterium]
MGAETRVVRFPERIMRQVRLDAHRALIKAHYCPDRSEVQNLRCVDIRRECEANYGSQLWYFDGFGVDETDRRVPIYGVVEYSIQFGLHELVEDGVFDHSFQRERFLSVYHREQLGPSWRISTHRWIAAMMVCVSVTAVGLLLKTLAL